MKPKKVLVTGANGFVGDVLCKTLRNRGIIVVPAVRCRRSVDDFEIGDLRETVDWSSALAGCDAVIHLAARVHIMDENNVDSLAQYRRVNVQATEALLRQAIAAGVRRFVFVSSIKVNGERTEGQPFRSSDTPKPQDPYGISKLEAEQVVSALSRLSGIEYTIVRPPLVYGPGVGANFRSLMKLVTTGFPLPFGCLEGNRRSLISVDNLVDFLILCSTHPDAAKKTFLVSDGEDLSTVALVRALAKGAGKKVVLLRVPVLILKAIANLLGIGDAANRLIDSLQINMSDACTALNWTPPKQSAVELAQTAQFFIKTK